MEKRHRGHLYWLQPNKTQEALLEQWQHNLAKIWNMALEQQFHFLDLQLSASAAGGSLSYPELEKDGKIPDRPPYNFFGMCYWVPWWRKHDKQIADTPSYAIRGCLFSLAESWKRYFDFSKNPDKYPHLKKALAKRLERKKGVRDFAKPRFRGKKDVRDMPIVMRGAHDSRQQRIKEGYVNVPSLGWVKIRMDHWPPGRVKSMSIRKGARRWHLSLSMEDEVAKPKHPHPGTEVGINRGVRHLLMLSDGKTLEGFDDNARLANRRRRMKFLQRKMSRQQRGSGKYKKTLAAFRRVHEDMTNIRQYHIHKLSDWITKNYETIYIDDYAIQNLVWSPRGTEDKPGKNVEWESDVNRRMYESALAELRQQIIYKAEDRGGRVVFVGAEGISQTCSCCGHRQESPEKHNFKCKSCGHDECRDFNAAKNVLAWGRDLLEAERAA